MHPYFPIVIEICEGAHKGQAFHVVIPHDLPINTCFKVLKTNVLDIGAFRQSDVYPMICDDVEHLPRKKQ